MEILIFGKPVHVEGTGKYFDSLGTHGEGLTLAFQRLVRASDICIDLGANIGATAIALGTLATKGRVLAVEPDPRTHAFLARNVRRSGLTNITTGQHLVGTDGKMLTFGFNVSDPACSIAFDNATDGILQDGIETTQMRCDSLDALVRRYQLPRVDFIKIDCEGAEIDILRSAADTLQRYRPIVVMEFNAHALMHFGRINPPDALDAILKTFPSVSRISITEKGVFFEPIENAYDFLYHHVLSRGCVDNLLCQFPA